jgi:hypothetical protein
MKRKIHDEKRWAEMANEKKSDISLIARLVVYLGMFFVSGICVMGAFTMENIGAVFVFLIIFLIVGFQIAHDSQDL